MAVDSGESIVVGVNRFAGEKGCDPFDGSPERKGVAPLFAIDPEVERRQIERVRAVRAGRSADACRSALADVCRAAKDSTNLVPPIITAVEAQATIGEISDAMRSIFGEYEEAATV